MAMNDIQNEKEIIRKELLATRDALPTDLWSLKSETIARIVLTSEAYKNADIIFVYADFHGEVGTTTIVENALLSGKAVYFPKVISSDFADVKMDFYRVYNTFELVEAYMGIKEPTGNIERLFEYDKNLDKNMLMFVPGVAFDRHGNRMGYGKGFYDTYLRDKEKIVKFGMCFDLQIKDEIPSSSLDVKLDKLICEEGFIDVK